MYREKLKIPRKQEETTEAETILPFCPARLK